MSNNKPKVKVITPSPTIPEKGKKTESKGNTMPNKGHSKSNSKANDFAFSGEKIGSVDDTKYLNFASTKIDGKKSS